MVNYLMNMSFLRVLVILIGSYPPQTYWEYLFQTFECFIGPCYKMKSMVHLNYVKSVILKETR